jgi:very-short-patch-repair endonuclease
MNEIKKKVIELGLKNAIVIRTNIDPFKINDPDMEQVRGVWRCGKRADKVDYFIGAVRLMPGKAKILGVWEIKSKPITVGKDFAPPKGWRREIDWVKRRGRKIFEFGKKIREDLDGLIINWKFQTPILYTNKSGNLIVNETIEADENYSKEEDRKSYVISRELRKTTGKGWEQYFLGQIINKFRNVLEPICQYFRKVENQRILIDLYYHQINLAIEIDEPYHSDQTIKDNIRQQKIIQSLGCNVFRIKVEDGNFDKQLDKLFTHINELIQSKNPKMIWRC